MYRAAHALKPDDIEKLASASVKVQKSTADTFAEGGQFLPLDVWRKQGVQINEENISEEDKGFSEVFGPTIRLRIQSRLTAATTDVAATINLAQRRGLKRKSSDALPIEPAPVPLALAADEAKSFLGLAPAPSAKADGEDSSSTTTSSTSSSSSSDSSSSDHKKKKKSAKGKKNKSQKKKKPTKEQKKLAKQKEAEAKQKQEEKEQQRQAQRDQKASAQGSAAKTRLTNKVNKVLPKLQTALDALKVSLANHHIILVPAVTLQPIQQTFLRAEALVDELRKVANGHPFPEADVGAVTKAVNLSTKDLKDVFKVLGRNRT